MGRQGFGRLAQVAGMVVLAGMHVDGKTPRRPVDVILYVDGIWFPRPVVDLGARLTVNEMYAGWVSLSHGATAHPKAACKRQAP